MPYNMDFIAGGTREVTNADIANAVREQVPNGAISEESTGFSKQRCLVVTVGGSEAVVVEIWTAREMAEDYGEQRAEFLDEVGSFSGGSEDIDLAISRIRSSVCAVLMQVLTIEDESGNDLALDAAGGILKWLDDHFEGVIRTDGEGYWLGQKMILEYGDG